MWNTQIEDNRSAQNELTGNICSTETFDSGVLKEVMDYRSECGSSDISDDANVADSEA